MTRYETPCSDVSSSGRAVARPFLCKEFFPLFALLFLPLPRILAGSGKTQRVFDQYRSPFYGYA
ncbi:hypothetical protein [Erwinia amylovora]|uniref:hypothetical protein n=1 Tax=Erwinia amylovora TaxID=552 RepID=UPI001443E05D|nr:hypothetical protein [Erwinia amylovora]